MLKYSKMIVGFSIFILSFLGIITINSTQHVQAASNFADVPSSYRFHDEIEFLNGKGVISGYQKINNKVYFKPGESVTRAQAAKMVVKAIGQSELKVTKPTFTDTSGNVLSGYIERAASLEIISGYDDDTYHPDEKLSRGQMSKILVNAFDFQKGPSNTVFLDVPSSYRFASEIQTLYNKGISNGNNGRFEPDRDVTRGELAAFISRAMNEKFKESSQKPTPAPIPVPEAKPVPEAEPAPTPVQNAQMTGEVTSTDGLNVRKGPGNSYSIIGSLKQGTIVDVYSTNGYWAEISYNNQIGYVHKTYLKLKNKSGSVLKNRIITVDPGHGGTDAGAVNGKKYEKDITLAVAKLVEKKLKSAGAMVVMTRTSDSTLSLSQRVKTATNHYSDLFISIHTNGASASNAKGTETYYTSYGNDNVKESTELAKEIQKQIILLVEMKDRKVKDSAKLERTKGQGFHVLREHNTTSVLVELGFISNPSDLEKLTSPEYQELFAQAIFKGIENYYKN